MAAKGARRLSSIALALLSGLIVFGVAAPIVISIATEDMAGASGRLVAAPRDSVVVTTVTALGPSKLLTIERGLVYPADARGKALDAPLSREQLAGGNSRFLVENATLRLQAGQTGAVDDHASPILDAIATLQFETVTLRKATLHVLLPDGRTEAVTDIDGTITNRRKTTLVATGRGYLRGQRVKLEFTTGVPGEAKAAAAVPLKLSIKAALLEFSLDGRAMLGGLPQVTGAVEFSVPDIRQVARWFGASWPAGEKLKDLTARGQFSWSGATMAIDRAAVKLDGNEGQGTLHLKFNGERPSIGGTLAFKDLDIGRYFPHRSDQAAAATAPSLTSLLATDLTLPLAQHLDADLRLSSDKVRIGGVTLGRVAAAVAIANGKMLADIGSFEFDGGRGNGQISADMSGTAPRLTLRGRLDDIDAGRISAGLLGHPVVTGKATYTADVTGTGRTGEDLLASSQGRMNIEIRSGGKIGLDVRGLAFASSKKAIEGWGASARGSTPFDTLAAAFGVRTGILSSDNVKLSHGDIATSLVGQVDLPTNRLNISIVQTPGISAAGKLNPGQPTSLQIVGPWAAPTIRNDSGRERAADPSLSDGSPARM